MPIPNELQQLSNKFWDDHSHEHDLTENRGCGQYIEAFVRYAQSNGFPKVGHLKKTGSGTNYNGHSNDGFLYKEAASPTNSLYQFVDIIANAESKPPYTSAHRPPTKFFGVDEPRYTDADWLAEPAGEGGEHDMMIPWIPYDENGFERLKKVLKQDYARRPQGADFDVSVWAARVFHSTYMGPEGVPLGMDGAMKRHRPEWCGALGVPVDEHWS